MLMLKLWTRPWTQPSYSECLHLDPAHTGNLHWMFTFGPSPVAATPPTSSPVPQISSQCIRKSLNTLCALEFLPSSKTRVTQDVAWVFTSWPSPAAAFSPSKESEGWKGKSRIKTKITFNYWINNLYTNFIKCCYYQANAQVVNMAEKAQINQLFEILWVASCT